VSYPNLSQITDPHLATVLKHLCDRLNAQERVRRLPLTSLPSLTSALGLNDQRIAAIGDPIDPQDGVPKRFFDIVLQQAMDNAFQTAQKLIGATTPPLVPGPQPPPPDPSGLTCHTNISDGQPGGVPGRPNLRWFRGNFIGIHVAGLPPVAGGANDSSLFLSFFLDRYSLANQNRILSQYVSQGFTHFQVSWPDSRSGNGQSEEQFVATCQLIRSYGLYTVVFFGSKNYDAGNFANYGDLGSVIDKLMAVAALSIGCPFWEGNLWIDPQPTIQQPIDFVCNRLVPAGIPVYVHFAPDYMSWQPNGQPTSYFWNTNVGKLTGLLHQKQPAQDCGLYQARLADVQNRFGGGFGFTSDSGFGHPFDVVAWEVGASQAFNGMSEAAADALGFQALCSPGAVPIMGFGNGCTGSP
jgi:hypothetical protein